MTILKDGGSIQLECEDCSHTTDVYPNDEFSTMIAEAKTAGWLIKIENGEWTHRCPDHKHGDRLARAQRMFR